MEIKIGIRHISREVTLETKESVETIRTKVADAITTVPSLRSPTIREQPPSYPVSRSVMLSSAPKRSAALGSVSAPNSRGTPNNFYEARIHGFAV